jgi:CMP-N,N'-diacetyllegionaminic acid synthase
VKILVLIPARGGSKRVPRKNIRYLGGKPLITWTIEFAKQIPKVCDILVSTDDESILDISSTAGALVPWLRPDFLATDNANSVDVALHALDWYESVNGPIQALLLLQPTSPFRSLDLASKGVEIFLENGMLPVIGVSKVKQHPEWMLTLTDGYLRPWAESHKLGVRSQDLKDLYIPNGSFYLISVEHLRSTRSFFQSQNIPLIASSIPEGIDIDTEEDFEIAERLISTFKLQ